MATARKFKRNMMRNKKQSPLFNKYDVDERFNPYQINWKKIEEINKLPLAKEVMKYVTSELNDRLLINETIDYSHSCALGFKNYNDTDNFSVIIKTNINLYFCTLNLPTGVIQVAYK